MSCSKYNGSWAEEDSNYDCALTIEDNTFEFYIMEKVSNLSFRHKGECESGQMTMQQRRDDRPAPLVAIIGGRNDGPAPILKILERRDDGPTPLLTIELTNSAVSQKIRLKLKMI